MFNTRLLGSLVAVAALTLSVVVAPTAAPAVAQTDDGSVSISPQTQGDLAIRESRMVDVSGQVPPGDIQEARQIAVTYTGEEQLAHTYESDDEVLNRPASPLWTENLLNLEGVLTGEIRARNAFGPPSEFRTHEPAQFMILEVDIAGETFRSNRLPVDYERPEIIRTEVVAPSQVRVVFNEAVRHDNDDLPTDWELTSPSRQVLSVEDPPDGDCVELDGVQERPEITDTGCSRILNIDQPLGEDEQITVEYVIVEGGATSDVGGTIGEGTRSPHVDFASNDAKWDDDLPDFDPSFRALDLIRPALPEITEVNGEPVGDPASRTSTVAAPTVTATNITEDHTARGVARLDGDVVAESSQRNGTGSGDTLSFELGELPDNGDYELTVVVTDPSGNTSTDTDKNPPSRGDGSPSTVAYSLIPVPPLAIASINGESVGDDGEVHDNVEAPSVVVSGTHDGQDITVCVDTGQDGSVDDDSATTRASGDTATVELDELPEASHGLTPVAGTDCSGQDVPSDETVTYHLDITPPTIDSAVTSGGPDVIVQFSEPVYGDNLAAQWTVQPGGPVTGVRGADGSAQRTLDTANPVESGASLGWQGLDPLAEDYHDRAGNVMENVLPIDQTVRTTRVPEVPSIDAVGGQSNEDSDPQGRAVFYYNDANPTVTVDGLHGNDIAVLYHDADGDGSFEGSEEVGTSDAAGPDGQATVEYDGADLTPGRHHFVTTARTPGDVESDPSDPAVYDLDQTPPTEVEPATLEGTTVQVRFSENVFGENRAAQWRLGDGTLVTGVQGDPGTSTRTLTLSSEPDESTEVIYEAGEEQVAGQTAYRDRNHNHMIGTPTWALEVGPIVDIPDPPDIVSISGAEQQEGAGDSWLGGDARPDVEMTTDEAGREVRLFHDRNGDGVGTSDERLGIATSSANPLGDPTATVSVGEALPEGTVPLIAYATTHESGQQVRSQPEHATLVLDLTDPEVVAAVTSGSRVTVTFTEPIFGRNLATEWEMVEGDGQVTSVSVGGTQAERIVEVSEPVQPGDRIHWEPADGGILPSGAGDRTASSHSGGLQAYHDRVDRFLDPFTADVSDVFPPIADVLDGRLSADTEGDAGTVQAVFDVRLDRAPDTDVRVDWTTVDGTAEGGSDYRSGGGTVVIEAGETVGRITVDVFGDTVVEDDETFGVRLTGADHATIGRSRASVTIPDDDAVPDGGTGGGDVGSGIQPEGGFVAVPDGVRRLWGRDRVETSVAISKATWDSADTVVIATSEKYPDALAGAALAAKHEAPLLLTPRASLHPAVAEEVRRLGAGTAHVLGGGAAVAGVVDDQLRDAGVEAVHRFAGADRFETARLIARAVGGQRVFVVEGAHADPNRGWPDAVSVSFLSAFQQAPILLVTHDSLPGPTAQALADLGASRATVVGGTAAVSGAVAGAVDDRVGDLDRVAGPTRYATSVAVARRALQAGLSHHNQWFGSGRNWPDSLTGAPAVARTGGVFLLVDAERLDNSPPIREWLVEFRRQIDSITFLGGVKALSQVVADQIVSQAEM